MGGRGGGGVGVGPKPGDGGWLPVQHMGVRTKYRIIAQGLGSGSSHRGAHTQTTAHAARVVSKGDTVTVHATGRLATTGEK